MEDKDKDGAGTSKESDNTEKDTESSSRGRGSAKKRKVYKMDPRSPLKRQRIKIERFQSPIIDEHLLKPKMIKEEITVLYKKGTFIAVRGAEETFYLCRTLQNVQNTTKRFRIQWLSLEKEPNIYKLDYLDHTEFACVLTNVRMDRVAKDTYKLPPSEQATAQKVLEKAIKVENGIPIDEDLTKNDDNNEEEDDDEEEEEEDEEDWEDVKSPAKKRKKETVKAKKGTGKKSTLKGKTKAEKKAFIIVPEKKKNQKTKGKAKKPKEKTERKKGPDRKLKPNPKIKVLEKEPFFETKEKVPFISIPVQSKLVMRAAILDNVSMLKDLLADLNVCKVNYQRSKDNKNTALDYAIRNGNKDMIELLIEDMCGKKRKVNTPPTPLLHSIDTGTYNPKSLGVKNVRKLNVSRGSREGNEAFKNDDGYPRELEDYCFLPIQYGCDWSVVDNVMTSVIKHSQTDREHIIGHLIDDINKVVILGQRKQAARLVEEAEKRGGFGFNFLHKEVLSFDKEDLRQNVMAISVRKKPMENHGITPVHCAAINPNIKYLSRLLSIEPDINVMDQKNRRPIHFAAACDGTGPLEFLLNKGASPFEISKEGQTALHIACIAGRAGNVDVLMKRGKVLESDFGGEMVMTKWGTAGIDRPDRMSFTPLHLAVKHYHTEVVRVLIKHGVNLNKQLSAGKFKMSPLMVASSLGQLDIVRMLVQAGATVELLDKHKRSALTHAVINGNTHIATYLLYLGADPNRADSSGNTLVHYAAAFGWYFPLKLLVKECGADAIVANHWKATALSLAFLKGNAGIVDFILTETSADINFTNDNGETLVCLAASSRLVEGLLPQIQYLVEKKGADPTLSDVDGNNALHRVSSNTVNCDLQGKTFYKAVEDTMALTVDMAKIFVKGGCDPSTKNNLGQTPIMLAISQGNTTLVKYLVESGGTISPEINEEGKNVLHIMAEHAASSDMGAFIQILAKKKSDSKEKMEVDGKSDEEDDPFEMLCKMIHVVDKTGRTPLLITVDGFSKTTNSRYMNKERLEEQYKNCVSFTMALLDCLHANINDTVQMIINDKEEKVYPSNGKWSCIRMIADSGNCIETNHLFSYLKLLLEYKPDLELGDIYNSTPLASAVSNNNFPLAQLLVENGAKTNVRIITGRILSKTETTPLLIAADKRYYDITELLIKNKADVKVTFQDGRTPLHLVVKDRSDESKTIHLVSLLLSHGADVNVKDVSKRTALHVAINSNNGTANSSTDLEEFLLEKGADLFVKDLRGRYPLHYVFVKMRNHKDNSSLDPIDLLSLITSAMKETHLDEPDNFNQTPLHRAAFRGATICCMHLIQRKANLHARDGIGNTPLSLAVMNKHESCAILLIQLGADSQENIVLEKPTVTSDTDQSSSKVKERRVLQWKPVQKMQKKVPESHNSFPVFQGAIRDEQQGVAFMLLEKTGINRTALEDAITVSKFHAALRLMKRIVDPKQVRGTNSKDQNLFHILLIKSHPGQSVDLLLKVAQKLLDLGVAINRPDQYGCTPIFYAALYHHPLSVMEFFLNKNPIYDVKWKDKFGRNIVAAYLWDFDLVDKNWEASKQWLELMKKNGASLDFHFDRPLQDPLAIGWVLKGQYYDYFTAKSSLGITPLIYALHNFHSEMVRFLLVAGASPNLADTNGLTPLMHAVKLNELHLVKVLLDYKWIPESEKEEEQPKVQKQLSRTVFNINAPLLAIPQIEEETEPQESDEEPEEEHEDEHDEEEDEEPEEDEEGEEEQEQDYDDEEAMDHDGENEEDKEEDEEEMEEDDDKLSDAGSHDTDVVDDDEPEPPPVISKLGSKKMSLMQRLSSKKEFKVVEKKSSVDMTAVDGLGWNVVHHAVASLDYGTFDNDEAIFILSKAGASVTQKDKGGLSPLDHALIRGAPKSATMIQKLMEIPEDKHEKPTKGTFEVKDSLPVDDKTYDFTKDYNELLKEATPKVNDINIDSERPVDPNCNFKNTASVYVDPKTNVPYDILMSKVNVQSGWYGRYSFYKMQVLHQKGKDLYVLFTRWGRIGDKGEYQHTPFPSGEEAAKEFCKIFKSKSGNDWSKLDSFENHTKKYRLIHQDKKKPVAKISVDLKSDITSKLSPEVLDLMTEMCEDGMIQGAVNSIGLDPSIMPFGQIKRDVLLEARKILQQIGELISIIQVQEKHILTEVQDDLQSNYEKICKLTNEYYHLIPMQGFAYEKIQIIDDKKKLRKHLQQLSDLLDLEVASKIILGAQHRVKEINPYDYIYKALNCKIQALSEDTIETQYLLSYIRSSAADVKPHCIYKLSRPGEEDTLNGKNLSNHRLLFHGSSMNNFISILNRGLLVAPFDVPITGHLFGEGLYTADCFQKSRGYSRNYSSKSKINLMLVCEVALGKCKASYGLDEDDLMDPEYNSLKIMGRIEPDPEFNVELPYGATIPLGISTEKPKSYYDKQKRRPYMNHNEYIIHDSSQLCLRYLIMYTP